MKKLIRSIATLAALVLLVSCRGKQEIIYEIRVVGDYSNFEALEAEFDKFEELYPQVNLIYEKVDKYSDIIETVLERETDKANIFFSYAAWTSGDPKYDTVISHMEDLSDPELELDLECLRPGLINHNADNKVLMLPVFSRTHGMLINKNLFEKEEIDIPETWDELLSVCDAFYQKGYESPMKGYSLKDTNCWMNTVAYPIAVANLANDPETLAKANELDSTAGEFMREALTKVSQLVNSNALDLDKCDAITDNYTQTILSFFEGDVPMMIVPADTVSGTLKRQSQSEAYSANPFEYVYMPIPVNANGGYFIDSPSIQFSVNKDCDNLDLTNAFMKFLYTNEELNAMSSIKRLASPTKDMSLDPVYAPFGDIPEANTFSPEAIGIKDRLVNQLKLAAFKVGRGQLTIEQAIEQYGSIR